MKNRKWLALLLALVLIAAACGSSGDDDGDATATEGSDTTDEPSEQSQVTVQDVMSDDATTGELVGQIRRAFESAPGRHGFERLPCETELGSRRTRILEVASRKRFGRDSRLSRARRTP